MDIWKLIWMGVLVAGVACFAYVSFTVIIKGFAEVGTLLREMIEG